MKKNVWGSILVAAMSVSMLAGCGSSAPATQETKAPAETKAAAETEATTEASGDETLSVWCWDPNFNVYAMKQAEKLYQKDHPNFKLGISRRRYITISRPH